jgi:predicted enzyme related to lactoylglutathione lyase
MSIFLRSNVLFVRDIELSKKFYVNLMEQEVEMYLDGAILFKSGLSIWQIDSIRIIPERLGYHKLMDKNANRFELYFNTDNLESFIKKIKSQKVQIVHNIIEQKWGQSIIRIFDPDNHLIEVGESDYTFLKKLLKRGMTPESISQVSYFPIEFINDFIKKNPF